MVKVGNTNLRLLRPRSPTRKAGEIADYPLPVNLCTGHRTILSHDISRWPTKD